MVELLPHCYLIAFLFGRDCSESAEVTKERFLLQIVAALPKQWFSDQQQTTMASLEALARFLATLAASMQRSSAGCPEAERKKAR